MFSQVLKTTRKLKGFSCLLDYSLNGNVVKLSTWICRYDVRVKGLTEIFLLDPCSVTPHYGRLDCNVFPICPVPYFHSFDIIYILILFIHVCRWYPFSLFHFSFLWRYGFSVWYHILWYGHVYFWLDVMLLIISLMTAQLFK